jgi:sulfotransferase family protein
MTMPNFLIIGTMKSGTTALYYYLEQHPQIYMSPVKEPNFFCSGGQEGWESKSVTRIQAYQHLFKDVSDEKAIGEASHCYLYEPQAVARIQQHLPDAKLVAILRNPVDRAYSHFLHMVRNGTEPLTDFVQALQEEETGAYQNRSTQDYVGRGRYYGQLKRYFDTFDRKQLKIYLYEDLTNAPINTLQDTFRFLGVDDSFVPDVSLRRNVSGYPRHKTLDKFLSRPSSVKEALKVYLPARLRWRLSKAFDDLKTRNLKKPPAVQPEIRRQLVGVYREDILQVQELIQRDLSGWLK